MKFTGFHPAFSRHGEFTYVQDRLRDAEETVAQHLLQGATVMVCGSSRMAQAVAQEIDTICQHRAQPCLVTPARTVSRRYLLTKEFIMKLGTFPSTLAMSALIASGAVAKNLC